MYCCRGENRPDAPEIGAVAGPPPRPGNARYVRGSDWPSRVAAGFRWAAPVATLALVPKCPACVAGYVLLVTGVGISMPAAAWVRWALIGASVVVLGWMVVRGLLRVLAAARAMGAAPPIAHSVRGSS